MYKVIKYFIDLQDGEHPYNVGDAYPREGLKVSDKRISELSSSNNRRHTPLIAEVSDVESDDKGSAPDVSEDRDDTTEKEPVATSQPEKKPKETKDGRTGNAKPAKSRSGAKK